MWDVLTSVALVGVSVLCGGWMAKTLLGAAVRRLRPTGVRAALLVAAVAGAPLVLALSFGAAQWVPLPGPAATARLIVWVVLLTAAVFVSSADPGRRTAEAVLAGVDAAEAGRNRSAWLLLAAAAEKSPGGEASLALAGLHMRAGRCRAARRSLRRVSGSLTFEQKFLSRASGRPSSAAEVLRVLSDECGLRAGAAAEPHPAVCFSHPARLSASRLSRLDLAALDDWPEDSDWRDEDGSQAFSHAWYRLVGAAGAQVPAVFGGSPLAFGDLGGWLLWRVGVGLRFPAGALSGPAVASADDDRRRVDARVAAADVRFCAAVLCWSAFADGVALYAPGDVKAARRCWADVDEVWCRAGVLLCDGAPAAPVPADLPAGVADWPEPRREVVGLIAARVPALTPARM